MTSPDDTFNKLRKQTFKALVEMASKIPDEEWRGRTPKEHAEWFEPTGWTYQEFVDAERDHYFSDLLGSVVRLEETIEIIKARKK